MTNKIKMPADVFYQLNELRNKQFEYLMNPLETMAYLRDREGFVELEQWIYRNDYPNLITVRLLDYIYGRDDIFEVDKPKKYVVRSKDDSNFLEIWYLMNDGGVMRMMESLNRTPIVKFDTKEEAEEWINPQTEVVEVEE